MKDFSTWVIVVGGLLFGLLMTITAIEEKFPSLKKIKPLKLVSEVVIVMMFLCIPMFIVASFIESANTPSAYEVCMQGMKDATDPQAIAYMEDYCYENTKG